MIFPFSIEAEYENEQLPIFTIVICALLVTTHVVVNSYLNHIEIEDLFYRFGAVPFDFKIWSPITCTFLHGNYFHLLGNVFFLWLYGNVLETRLGFLKFLFLYIFGAYISIAAHIITVAEYINDDPAVGASGAISAILGAFFVIFPNANIKVLVFSPISFRPLLAHAPAFIILGLWFLGQVAYALLIGQDYANVAFWAHIAGFAAGVFFAVLHLKHEELLDKKSENERKIRFSHLAKALMEMADNNSDNARKFFAKFNNRDKTQYFSENWRLAEAFLLYKLDDDKQSAIEKIHSELERINRFDDGLLLQAYLLACVISHETLGAHFHLRAAIAAKNCSRNEIAKFAFAYCARNILSNRKDFEILADKLINAFAKFKQENNT